MAKRRHEKETTPAVSPWRSWLPQALLIIAAGFWIYAPALHGGWLWDDNRYITDNSIIKDPAGFWKVWITEDWQGNYYPLTAFVACLQWNLLGGDTFGYHLTSLVLHLASAFLVWRLLARLGLRFAWLGGLLFTVHPVMVESVAWISELKNTLSLPPLLLAMLAWLDWRDNRTPRSYRHALVWFLVSLLAKTSGAMLPLVLLGHAWWKTGKIARADLRAIAPFLVVALLPVLLTLFPAPGGNPESLQTHWKFLAALACVGWSTFFLIGKCVLPIDLLPVYPSLATASPTLLDLVPWIVLGLLALLLGLTRQGWGRHLLFGTGFFFVNLAPVLAFILFKYTNMIWSMDHLVYLPIIGLIGLAVAGIEWLDRHLAPALRAVERVAVAAALIVLAWGSHAYAGWYQNTETLWTRTLERCPASWQATSNLSTDLLGQGCTDEAMKYALETLALRPDWSLSHYNLGVILEKTGQADAAIDRYQETLRINPKNEKAIISLGGLLYKKGNRAEAITLYQTAIQASPDVAQLRYNLGSILLQSGDVPGAIEQLQAAVELNAQLAPAQENLGSALAQTGRLREAIPHFAAAVEAAPSYVIARNNLALALAQTGHIAEAIAQFQQVLAIDPENAKAKDSLTKLQGIQR